MREPLLDSNRRQVVLEPLTAAHAPEMFQVLSDRAIYEFENEPPSSEAALFDRYRKLESRQSPDGQELWLNWLVRLPGGQAAGYVQATVLKTQTPRVALVAYELGSVYWRQGIGHASVAAMLQNLQMHHGVEHFAAVLKTINHRSMGLLTALGFRRATPVEAGAFDHEGDDCVMTRGPVSDQSARLDRGFDLTPMLRSSTITLRAAHAQDFEALYTAASDPGIWASHPSPHRFQHDVFRSEFWDSAAPGVKNPGSPASCLLLVLERHTGEVIGSSRFYDWNPDDQSVAVGYSFLIRRHWGGTTNAELKRLMLDHAFQKARTVWFHIGADNWRSRRAVEKICARLSHEVTREVQGRAQRVMHYRIDAALDPQREAR